MIFTFAASCLCAQTIYLQGNITNDSILHADTIKVTGEVSVLDGITMTIVQGAYVEFQGCYKLNVHGRLLAIGNITDTICFTIHDTTGFSDTNTVNGGWHGIHFENIAASNDTSKILYCKLQYGKARGDSLAKYSGGAVFINNFSKVIISNSLICNNLATIKGGGCYCGENSSPIIDHCSFNNNKSYDSGGGIYVGANSNIVISSNTFTGNIAFRKWQSTIPPYLVIYTGAGGGIYSSSADLNVYCPTIINNRIFNNKSVAGGGIYESNYHLKIINNLICNNEGSGVFNGHQLGQGMYINNTICNNSNLGGIECFSSHISIINNIIWGNIYIMVGPTQIILHLNANPLVQYCDIEDGYTGIGNITDLPLFVQPSSGAGLNHNGSEADWSLQHDSPCIDSGIPDTTGLSLPETDIAGNPRISYYRIDIGAYEKQFATSADKEQSAKISIYPNPTSDRIFIQNPFSDYLSFELYDLTGRMIYRSHISCNNSSIDLSFLNSGLFFYRIHCQDKTISKGKIIKN
jgi:predicted outer membrane repeat protein